MDIEGAEPRALAGMEQLLTRHRPTLLTELAPALLRLTSGVEPRAYLEKLAALGYDLYILEREGPKSSRPQTVEELLVALDRLSGTHLDLVGYPRGRG
jgi:hypothetical protein